MVVVHDAAVLREPAASSAAYRTWHRRLGLTAARRARAVVTVSEFSRRELIAVGGIEPSLLRVIPGGVDGRFGAADGPTAAADAAAAVDLQQPYVLTVATADARKNFTALMAVAAALRARGVELVWAGDTRAYFSATAAMPGLRAVGVCPRCAAAGPLSRRTGVRAAVAL